LSKYLIEKGIDLSTANIKLDTALSLARNSNDIFAIKYIFDAIEKKKQ